MFGEKTSAGTVLVGHDPHALRELGENASYVAGGLEIVARAKLNDGVVAHDLEERILLRASEVYVGLGRLLGVQDEIPLVEAIDLLCRRSGSGGTSRSASC